jgi:hypothetical protein
MKLAGIKKHITNILPMEIKNWQFIVYLSILLFCFLFFQQSDLYHTIASSNAYLSGHFADFYDYNKLIMGGNDYLPILYLVFALWNLPLKILGLMLPTTLTNISFFSIHQLTTFQIYWSKLLLVFLFFAVISMLYQIAKIISNGNKELSKNTASIFATAPIAIYAVFIIGQYDIIGMLITLIGYYYYLQKNLTRFAWFFSFAISFKFLPIIIFIPLLLLSEKRIIYLIKYIFIALFVTLVQVAIYCKSMPFREHTLFSLAGGKLNALAEFQLSGFNHSTFLIIFYIVICLYSFIKEPVDEADLHQQSIFISIATYGVLFSTVIWHPQWVSLITPFFAIATLYIKQKEKFYLIELIGMLAFVLLVINSWPTHHDVNLIKTAPLGYLFPTPLIINMDLMGHRYVSIAMALFFIYLFSPLLILFFQKSNKTNTIQSKSACLSGCHIISVSRGIVASDLAYTSS